MPLKIKIMKYINNKLTIAIITTICSVWFVNAQEIIKDTVKTKSQFLKFQKQLVNSNKRPRQ